MEEENDQKISSDKIQKTDQLKDKEEIVGLLGESDNSLKSDVTQKDDKIKTTEKVANKQGNDFAQLKDKNNTKKQA